MQTHPSEKRNNASSRAFVSFVNPSCKYFTKIQTHPSEKRNNDVSLSARLYLSIITQPKDSNASPKKGGVLKGAC
jgi:hypothetical protein